MAVAASNGHRFSVYTPTDHQAPLWILSILSFLYCALFLLVRLAIKHSFWGPDDLVLVISHVFALGQWAMIYKALHLGLGKAVETVKPNHLGEAATLVFTSRILNLIAIGLSKCCVVLFLRLLFTKESRAAFRLCTICSGIAAIWTIAAPLIISVGCSTSHTLGTESSAACPGDITRWRLVTAIDVFFEVGLLALPAYLFSTLRMNTERKLTVTTAFAFRLGVMAVFIVYLVTYEDFRDTGRPNIGAITPLIWQQILLATALLTATVPCLKGFLGRFKTLDLVTITETTWGYGAGSFGTKTRSANRSFALSSIDRRNGTKGRDPAADEWPIRQQAGEFTATAYANPHGEDRTGSMRSLGSDQMIIHRKIEMEVSPHDHDAILRA